MQTEMLEFSEMSSEDAEKLRLRLREAVKIAGGAKVAAPKTGVAVSTLYGYLKLEPAPPVTWVYALCGAAPCRPAWLFLGEGQPHNISESGDWETASAVDDDIVRVPIYPIEVSAGPGREPFHESPAAHLAFPGHWLRSMFGTVQGLRIVRVAGDSQEPELRNGDDVMFDENKRDITGDGMFVVRRGSDLMVKRVQRLGNSAIRLLSANPTYPPIDLDLAHEGDSFAVIGKAIWTGRSL